MIGSPIKHFYYKMERHFEVLYNPNSDNIIIMPHNHELIQGETFDIKYNEMIDIIKYIDKNWKKKEK